MRNTHPPPHCAALHICMSARNTRRPAGGGGASSAARPGLPILPVCHLDHVPAISPLCLGYILLPHTPPRRGLLWKPELRGCHALYTYGCVRCCAALPRSSPHFYPSSPGARGQLTIAHVVFLLMTITHLLFPMLLARSVLFTSSTSPPAYYHRLRCHAALAMGQPTAIHFHYTAADPLLANSRHHE